MVDSLFQGFQGQSGTQNAIMSSSDYISNAQRSFNNIEEGFYISPAFLDKISIHVAKNFMDLPKIKVPLILGIWGGKGQVRRRGAAGGVGLGGRGGGGCGGVGVWGCVLGGGGVRQAGRWANNGQQTCLTVSTLMQYCAVPCYAVPLEASCA
jgi:hypothetical protein